MRAYMTNQFVLMPTEVGIWKSVAQTSESVGDAIRHSAMSDLAEKKISNNLCTSPQAFTGARIFTRQLNATNLT